MPKIFLSYRRVDSQPIVERIHDRLAARFGNNNVFLDIDLHIPPGSDFAQVLQENLLATDILIVVIGKRWATELRKRAGQEDFVRFEVETGLQQVPLVIPILVDRAEVPSASDLPVSMQGILSKNILEVLPNPYFNTAMDILIAAIDNFEKSQVAKSTPPVSEKQRMPLIPIIFGIIVLVAVILGGLLLSNTTQPATSTRSAVAQLDNTAETIVGPEDKAGIHVALQTQNTNEMSTELAIQDTTINSYTHTPTYTPSITETDAPSFTPTNTMTSTPSRTPAPTQTPLPPTSTFTPSPTLTVIPSQTPTPQQVAGSTDADTELAQFDDILLAHQDDNRVEMQWADVDVRDFIAEAHFDVPYNVSKGDFDFGFIFRKTKDRELRFIVQALQNSSWIGYWELTAVVDDEFIKLDSGQIYDSDYDPNLEIRTGNTNILQLQIYGDQGLVMLNGTVLTTLSLDDDIQSGDVGIGTEYFNNDSGPTGSITHVAHFQVSNVIYDLPEVFENPQTINGFIASGQTQQYTFQAESGDLISLYADSVVQPIGIRVLDGYLDQIFYDPTIGSDEYQDYGALETNLVIPVAGTYQFVVEGNQAGDSYFNVTIARKNVLRNPVYGDWEGVVAEHNLIYAIDGQAGDLLEAEVSLSSYDWYFGLYNKMERLIPDFEDNEYDPDRTLLAHILPIDGLYYLLIPIPEDYLGQQINIFINLTHDELPPNEFMGIQLAQGVLLPDETDIIPIIVQPGDSLSFELSAGGTVYAELLRPLKNGEQPDLIYSSSDSYDKVKSFQTYDLETGMNRVVATTELAVGGEYELHLYGGYSVQYDDLGIITYHLQIQRQYAARELYLDEFVAEVGEYDRVFTITAYRGQRFNIVFRGDTIRSMIVFDLDGNALAQSEYSCSTDECTENLAFIASGDGVYYLRVPISEILGAGAEYQLELTER